ncbi:MAG TPA: hypothetical protein VFW33_03895 [Gemmataceae bacterium]|nr:hypothetical protein [Gemmataceae bacterium]
MTTTATLARLLTLGQVADRLRAQLWQVQRVIDRGLVPDPPRLGRNRVVCVEDLPAYRTALAVAGFLKGEEAGPAAR